MVSHVETAKIIFRDNCSKKVIFTNYPISDAYTLDLLPLTGVWSLELPQPDVSVYYDGGLNVIPGDNSFCGPVYYQFTQVSPEFMTINDDKLLISAHDED